MDRVQKRCFTASLTLHSLLVGVVLFGSAFFASRERTETIPVLTFIPDIATDGQFAGGGHRVAGTPAPTPPANRQVQPPVTQPASTPPSTPARIPARASEPSRPSNTHQTAVEPRPQSRIQLPDSALRPVDRGGKKSDDRKSPRAPAPNTARSNESPNSSASTGRNQLAASIQKSLNRIGNSTSGSTTVESPGDGTGGAFYAPYAAIIRAIYMEAWQRPEELNDGAAVTEVEIEVAKDGTVISSRIVDPSGNARVDRSVQDALNRVRFIKEFPASWKEQRRTFRIRFDLKVREQLLG